MPHNEIALEPSKKRRPLKVVLSGYEDLPEDQRPAFEFKRLSFRKFRDVASIYDGLAANKSAGEALTKIAGALKPNLLSWSNVVNIDTGDAEPFNPEKLEDVVDMGEGKELLKALMTGGVTEEARKN